MPQVSLATVIAAAQAGQLISFPTDTVPALAVRPDQAERIFVAKGRALDKPLILMAATAVELWPFVQTEQEAFAPWQTMAQTYWPGALTLVLPASERVPAGVNPRSHTIGLRVPQWPQAQHILAQTGPLATTSINRSGQPPLLQPDEIAQQFPQVSFPEPWDLPNGEVAAPPSTVIQWQEGTWQILRQGAVQLAHRDLIHRE